MDGTERKREEIKNVYPTASWAEKVKKMSDVQVMAIYFRFKKEGKIT